MKAQDILECRDKAILFVEERGLKDIVIAVPHHAPLGVPKLRYKRDGRDKDADENAGMLGLYTAQLLNCRSIIACNYFIDCNREDNSDYFKKLLKWRPRILVEIHGHGGKKANYDIEISSGSLARNKWSKEVASRLRKKMAQSTMRKRYKICGDYNKIHFKASDSKTITSNKWIPFHIELPFSLRARRSEYYQFCELLAETLREILGSYDQIASR